MTIIEMLEQSGVLALLGMGTVFGFLIIMIITINVAGKLMGALGLNKETAAAPATAGSAQNAQVTAAISAAVTEYRKSN